MKKFATRRMMRSTTTPVFSNIASKEAEFMAMSPEDQAKAMARKVSIQAQQSAARDAAIANGTIKPYSDPKGEPRRGRRVPKGVMAGSHCA